MTILTGYINIKKENLKTDLNNETITKDEAIKDFGSDKVKDAESQL